LKAYSANVVHDEHLSSKIRVGLLMTGSKINYYVIVVIQFNVNLLDYLLFGIITTGMS